MKNRRKPATWPDVDRLRYAAILVKELREEKSDHPWSNRECALLVQLCEVLGVET
jgi:hypothetical protein